MAFPHGVNDTLHQEKIMESFEGKAVFYEKSDEGKFTDLVIREESLSFDLVHYGEKYTVSLNRKSGSLYKGKAIHHISREDIPLTARVVEDPETGLMIISGTEWGEGGANWMWFAEISPV